MLAAMFLLGGEPGAGKSTLSFAGLWHFPGSHHVLYVTGEESTRQIKLRANQLAVLPETSVWWQKPRSTRFAV